ncbi:hypothetical protein ACIRJ3_05145 [Streptomyces anulatus]
MKSSPTAPITEPSRKKLNKSAELYIRGLLADVISGSRNEVRKSDLVFVAAAASARGDAFATQNAGDLDSAVVPAIDQDVAEVGH